MSAFTLYDPATQTPSALTSALLAATSGIAIDTATINLKSGMATRFDLSGLAQGITDASSFQTETYSISFYDGSIASLGIGAGILLTSGDGSPPITNTDSSYGLSLTPSETDADLNTSIQAAFSEAGEIQDATVLEFQFTINDTSLKNIKFDVIFGSDEFPEFSDSSFVDIAGVYVNGVN